MKVYLVNLDKNKQRLAHMHTQLMRHGIEFERISAVYGQNLDHEEMRRSFAHFRSLCAMGRKMTYGEIGCAISHIGILKRVEQPVCILEDDIEISGDLRNVLDECQSFLLKEVPRVVLLSGHCFTTTSQSHFVRVSSALCTDAYCINRAAAQLIVHANDPVVSVADSWYRWSGRYGIELYHYNPSIARQNNELFGSDISPEVHTKRGGFQIGQKIFRVFTKLVDLMHFLICGN